MKKLALVIMTLVALTLPATVHADASPSVPVAASRLASNGMKKVALPLTLIFLSTDAYAAYNGHCKRHTIEKERVLCAGGTFVETQANDLGEVIDDARFIGKHVIVPKAKQFWAEHGDDIKNGAENAGDTLLQGFAAGINWLANEDLPQR
ncbi:hypothetical protein [Stappia sp. ES.058]|uniref:hypothetical protein n=1 Tax=Stappia sp. ES.058 TaxID=1881061 RepID=UPI00087A3A19|nr:hypothetical protein [Stappia sp. ES.058]SDU16507.1 hypothetical protein SAMN05428979_2027 [Stappia sp. ES.058]